MTSTLASKLASKTKCALVGLSCIRRDDGRGFDIYCYKLDDPALYDRNTETAAHALNIAMQHMIEAHYSHYMWGYRRFKQIPLLDNPYRADEKALADFINGNIQKHALYDNKQMPNNSKV